MTFMGRRGVRTSPLAAGSWAGTVAALAAAAGLDLVGIVPVEEPGTVRQYEEWLAAGYHGEMAYLARPDAVERRRDPARILPGARTAVVVGLCYHTWPLPPELRDDPSRGIVASYAWGPDYHDVMLPHLHRLAGAIACQAGRAVAYRAVVFDLQGRPLRLLGEGLILPAYDYVVKCSHLFNILDARGAVSVSERTSYIARIRDLARRTAGAYVAERQRLGFPLASRAGSSTVATSCWRRSRPTPARSRSTAGTWSRPR